MRKIAGRDAVGARVSFASFSYASLFLSGPRCRSFILPSQKLRGSGGDQIFFYLSVSPRFGLFLVFGDGFFFFSFSEGRCFFDILRYFNFTRTAARPSSCFLVAPPIIPSGLLFPLNGRGRVFPSNFFLSLDKYSPPLPFFCRRAASNKFPFSFEP